ncbi:hypothetical protein, partial [Escherichia coli]|uniref:hypothetical protein n=1 Tax=Escherichia coli TaxID=562 RepID=UPI0039E144F6
QPDAFSYGLASEGRVRTMSYQELKGLSPAEKYDILEGRYDYPTVKAERERTHKNDATWYGLCHGLGPASIAYREPK